MMWKVGCIARQHTWFSKLVTECAWATQKYVFEITHLLLTGGELPGIWAALESSERPYSSRQEGWETCGRLAIPAGRSFLSSQLWLRPRSPDVCVRRRWGGHWWLSHHGFSHQSCPGMVYSKDTLSVLKNELTHLPAYSLTPIYCQLP